MSDTPSGTYTCDICGLETPHYHADSEVERERYIRPAFEKTTVPRNYFGRMPRTPNTPYSDGNTEQLWQHFVSGWNSSRQFLTAERDALRAELSRKHKALVALLGQLGNIEVLGEWSALDINPTASRKYRATVDRVVEAARAAIAETPAPVAPSREAEIPRVDMRLDPPITVRREFDDGSKGMIFAATVEEAIHAVITLAGRGIE